MVLILASRDKLASTQKYSRHEPKMKVIISRDFTGDRPWAALDAASVQGTTT